MMRIMQIFVFVMTSILEVRVHAETYITLPEAKAPIQLPENCLVESTLCTVRTVDLEKFTIDFGRATVVLPAHSVFIRTSSSSGVVVKGHVWVKSNGSFKVESPYGDVLLSKAEVLIYHDETKLTVRVLAGTAVLKPRGHSEDLTVQAGFENWMGRVDTSAKATIGIHQAFDIKTVVMDLAPLQNEGKSVFESKLRELREAWTYAVNVSSDHYGIVVERSLATQEEKRKQEESAHKKWEAERNEWRKILWQKNFE